jgi:imidazolonepropionase
VNFVFLPNMKTIIKNIEEIIQTEKKARKWVAGKEMKKIQTIKNGFIEIEDGVITRIGDMHEWKGIENWNNIKIIDADGGMVFPSYCDSHTHLVFNNSREQEFIDRINGLSYQEIAKKGGGILNSADSLNKTSESELYKKSLNRINKLIRMGTGAIEIKSGYGLTLEGEIKMLKVIKRLKEETEITIKSTFLGAHALPVKFKNNKKKYIDLIINEMLPLIAKEGLADYIDVFCEKNYFTVNDTKQILEAANKFNIRGKTHVNQFNSIGGVRASVEMGALSVDHLEEMKDDDYKALTNSQCMPTILPSCSFFLSIPYGPARKIIDQGMPLALASDYNPGSSPSGNMNFVSSLGCIKLNMNPEEVINATTINSAYAMGEEERLGSICVGKKANLFITQPIPSYSYLHYNFGSNIIKEIILNGALL